MNQKAAIPATPAPSAKKVPTPKAHVKRLTSTPPTAVESPLGKALKARVQQFLGLYDEIEALEAAHKTKLKGLQERYDAVHADLLGDLNVAGLDMLKGPETGGRTIKKDRKSVATIEDFDAICAFIKENDAFELLQKRLSSTAVSERQQAGEVIPGVGKFEQIKLKVTK